MRVCVYLCMSSRRTVEVLRNQPFLAFELPPILLLTLPWRFCRSGNFQLYERTLSARLNEVKALRHMPELLRSTFGNPRAAVDEAARIITLINVVKFYLTQNNR